MSEGRRRRPRGGKVSLTAFEAEWLAMVADPNPADAIAAMAYLETPPAADAAEDPSAAWQRIVDKLHAVANRGG
jgi:hypothetical protein